MVHGSTFILEKVIPNMHTFQVIDLQAVKFRKKVKKFYRFWSGTGLNVSNKSCAETKNQDRCLSQLFSFGKIVQKCLVLQKIARKYYKLREKMSKKFSFLIWNRSKHVQ